MAASFAGPGTAAVQSRGAGYGAAWGGRHGGQVHERFIPARPFKGPAIRRGFGGGGVVLCCIVTLAVQWLNSKACKPSLEREENGPARSLSPLQLDSCGLLAHRLARLFLLLDSGWASEIRSLCLCLCVCACHCDGGIRKIDAFSFGVGIQFWGRHLPGLIKIWR